MFQWLLPWKHNYCKYSRLCVICAVGSASRGSQRANGLSIIQHLGHKTSGCYGNCCRRRLPQKTKRPPDERMIYSTFHRLVFLQPQFVSCCQRELRAEQHRLQRSCSTYQRDLLHKTNFTSDQCRQYSSIHSSIKELSVSPAFSFLTVCSRSVENRS